MVPLDQSLLQLHKHAVLLDKSDIPVREDKACATDRPNYLNRGHEEMRIRPCLNESNIVSENWYRRV